MKTLDATTAQAWCLVQIGARPFAIALHAVAEIVEADEFVRVPLCSPQVLGLCTYRRDLVPVFALFEGPSAAPGPAEGRPVVLILRTEQGTWGIQIDRGGTSVADGPLGDRGTVSTRPGGAVVIGSVTRGEVTHAVIDAEATWRNVRDAVERWYKGDRDRDWDRRDGALVPDSTHVPDGTDLLANSPSRDPR